MTIELTHKQAALMRTTSFPSDDSYELHMAGLIDCIEGTRCRYRLSDNGHEALAAYDAKWVPVERWRLQEVNNYISESDPPMGAPDNEVADYHVASAHCQIMLTGKGPYGEPTDGSKECSPP